MVAGPSVRSLVSIAFVGRLLGRGLTYGMFLYVAQTLGPAGLGAFTIGLLVLTFGGAVTRLGMDATVQKFVPIARADDDDQRVTGVILFCLAVPFVAGLVLAAGVYAARGAIAPVVGDDALTAVTVLALGIPLFGVYSVGESATLAFKRTRYAVYVRDFGQAGSAAVLVVAATVLSESVLAISVAYLLSLVVASLVAVLALARLGAFRGLRAPTLATGRVSRYSMTVLPGSLAGPVIRWADVFVLSLFVTATQVGWYQSAYQTAALLLFALVSVNAVFPPLASELHAREETATLQSVYSVVTKWVAVFTLLGAAYVVVFRVAILGLFGPSFRAAEWALVLLAVGRAVEAMAGPSGFLLSMAGYERLEMANTSVAAVLNVVLNLLLVVHVGFVGAAIATTVTFTLLNVARLAEVRLLAGFWPYARAHLLALVPVAVAVGWMVLVAIIGLPPLPRLVVGGTGSLVAFGLVASQLPFSEGDRLLVRSIDDF